jgi:hypothetical protein
MIQVLIGLLTWFVWTMVLIMIFYNAMSIDCPTNPSYHDLCQHEKNYATTTFILLVGGPPTGIILGILGIRSRGGG